MDNADLPTDYDDETDSHLYGTLEVCSHFGQIQIQYTIEDPYVRLIFSNHGDMITAFNIAYKNAKVIDYLIPLNPVSQMYPLNAGIWFDDERNEGGRSFITFSRSGEIYLNNGPVITFEEFQELY